ncbi:MAG: hypothetical protein AAGI37_15140 [Planctomycetota bacterium]
MTERPNKSLRSALDEERRRLASQAFPGDLARVALQEQQKAGLPNAMRYASLATAIIVLGVVVGIALRPTDDHENNTPQAFSAQPSTPGTPTPETAAASQPPSEMAQTPPAQPTTIQTARAKPPEIDRALLPVRRNTQTTWLAGPTVHRGQLERHSRLAEHPNPNQRVRLSLSTPTRSSINQAFTRTLALKPRPKPQGTQNESV